MIYDKSRYSASQVLISAVILICYIHEGTLLASADRLFNRQRKQRSQSAAQDYNFQTTSLPPPPPPLPLHPVQDFERVNELNSETRQIRNITGTATALSRIRASTENFASKQTTSLSNILSYTKTRLASRRKNSKQQDIATATRLSGGAESPSETAIDVAEESPDKSTTKRAFLGNLGLKNVPSLPQAINLNDTVAKKVKEGMVVMQKTSAQVGPSFFSVVSLLWTADQGISFLSLYAISLFGASCGFYLFLYFITIGYALGISLPLMAALFVYNKHKTLSSATFFHSAITVAWGIRMLTFTLWREYISWPALHKKVVELQAKMDIPFASKLLCWCVYSFFYVAMMSMNWSRLQQDVSKWGILGSVGLLMQLAGLVLETIADLQKNGFKSRYRHAWCNVGVWKWSTHPNYLGEGMFWWGTYLAHGFCSVVHSLLATIGLVFITFVLKGSTRSITMKHLEKYGDQAEFYEFQRTHGVWGPKRWWWWLNGMEELSKPKISIITSPQEGNNTNTSAFEEVGYP